jgi:hypothetical protein
MTNGMKAAAGRAFSPARLFVLQVRNCARKTAFAGRI